MQGCVGLCRSVCRTMQVYVGPKKIRPFGPQFGLKIREGGGGGWADPGSATDQFTMGNLSGLVFTFSTKR